jgi:hypothetical protein
VTKTITTYQLVFHDEHALFERNVCVHLVAHPNNEVDTLRLNVLVVQFVEQIHVPAARRALVARRAHNAHGLAVPGTKRRNMMHVIEKRVQ